MLKNMAKVLVLFLTVGLVVGCSSTKKIVKKEPKQTTTIVKTIETRFYAEDRQREDQVMEGNFGYLSGTPVPEDRSQYKDTRKIYIFEVTKNVKEAVKVEGIQVEPYHVSPSKPLPAIEDIPDPEWAKPISIPAINVEEVGELYFEEYVVEEGDTLQKISKKFYDTYSRWVRIYEANEDVLKDPNRIKPGTTIQIPMNK